MTKRLYVGNVPYDLCTDEGLRELFDGHDVESTHVVVDKETQRPRGFCFVEMPDAGKAQLAMSAINGSLFYGRNVTVRLAHDKPRSGGDRPRRARN